MGGQRREIPGGSRARLSRGPDRTGAGSGTAGEGGPSTTTAACWARAGRKGKEAGAALACAAAFRNEHKKVSSDRWFNGEKWCDYVRNAGRGSGGEQGGRLKLPLHP